MLPFLGDHDFNYDIVRGVRRRAAELGIPFDIVTAREAGLHTAADPELLDWAATHGRAVLTRDVNTLVGFAWERVSSALPMPGVFPTAENAPVGQVIEDLLLLSECSIPGEWEGRIYFLPIK